MQLDDYGYFDGGVFIFRQPFPLIHDEGVTLMSELDMRRFHKQGIDLEKLVSHVIKQQIGVPDPLRERDPHQDAPKTDPGE